MARFFKPQKRKITDTKHKEITINRFDHQGAGIGYLDHKPVFVDGALPGEQVVVQLTEDKKQYARAKVMRRLNDSDQRVEPACPLYAQCGGCNLQHLSHDGQIGAKQQALGELMGKFAKAGNIEQAAPIASAAWGYRRCARFAVLPAGAGLRIGFRKKQSKEIVDVAHCPVLAESLNALLPPLRTVLGKLQARKALGHVELVEADNGRVVLIRHLQPFSDKDMTLLREFADTYQVMLFLAPSAEHLEAVSNTQPYYELDGLELLFSPKDFIQVNAEVNRKMVAQAIDWLAVTADDRVLDLFCGLGNFSLPLAKQAKALVGVEGIDEMVHRAGVNARHNGLENATFFQANLDDDVTKMIWAQERFDKVLLDPARAGAAGVMQHVVGLRPECVVYVSCNPATLARDSQMLLEQGYQLEKLGMMDMFPHTGHLESMALFVKQS